MPPRKKSTKNKTLPKKHRAPAKRPARKMPAFTKPSARTVDAFAGAVGPLSGVEHRTMFGYPSVFLNGNMLACVFQDRIMVRLSDADRAAAMSEEGAKLFEPSPGRAMREYVELPKRIADDPAALSSWLQRGRNYVQTLPKKAKTKR
jgi:TfoX/Sxy family transcriptional regulator of competence genes